MLSPALIVSLPTNRFPNMLASNVPKNILRSPPFCYFAACLIILLTPFVIKPGSSSDLTIFIISFISSLEIINLVLPDPIIF